jgi:hypothetical protein
VTETRFVGGGFGASSETAMMKEILHGGPIEGALNWAEVEPINFSFKSGMITRADQKKVFEKLAKLAKFSPLAWQLVDQ